jgi:hypothetical protein
MTEPTLVQKTMFALWENSPYTMLLPGRPFDCSSYSDREENLDAHFMQLANRVFKAVDKPEPGMDDFMALFSIDIAELYELDDPVDEDGTEAANEFVKDVHRVLNERCSSDFEQYSYSIDGSECS